MILYVGLIALLALQNAKFCLRSFNKNYLSKEGTDAVRGIFILLIFAAHFNSYADLTIAPLDIAYRKIWIAMGQMVVTCFLFYSGYGIALSARKKGDVYIHSMPRKRILPTLLIFDCSVILYLLLQIFRGRTYGIKELILALLAWGGFGNSNWYIFSILGCYLITWIVLRGRELNQVTVARITVCSVVFILALFCSGRDSWWYNTILCYPLGMWYFLYQDKIDLFMSKNTHYWPVLALTGIAFLVAHKFWYPSSSLTYMLTMLLFTLCVVFLTMKIQIRSPILIYCGKHLQGLYTQKETYGAGGYQQSDVDYTRSFENRAEREAAVMDRLIDRMKNPQRSLVEHILFQKVRRTWGNGSLAADDYAGRGIIYQSALHKFFLRNGTSWKPARTIMQFWWILLLGANLLGMIIQFKEGKLSFAFITHLTIFGFFLFYLIWETNSRYLVVLIPILTLSAADGICKFYNLDLTSTSKQGDDAF